VNGIVHLFASLQYRVSSWRDAAAYYFTIRSSECLQGHVAICAGSNFTFSSFCSYSSWNNYNSIRRKEHVVCKTSSWFFLRAVYSQEAIAP
jgi:hypothetical protein